MRQILSGASLVTTCFLASGFAFGCDLCFSPNGNAFALPHPRALEIAVATRSALDKGILSDVEANGSGWNRKPARGSGFDSLKTWIEKQNEKKVVLQGGPLALHLVLIDTSESITIHFRSGSAVLDMQARGHSDAVVVTTSHGLRVLLSGGLSLDRAEKSSLVVIEGRRALADALVNR